MALDVDKRSIQFLKKKLPTLNIIHQDVLETDWVGLAVEKGGPLSLIGNLPFNISSQILFDIIDHRRAVSHAVFTTQYEVTYHSSASHSLDLSSLPPSVRLLVESFPLPGQRSMASSQSLSNSTVVQNTSSPFLPLLSILPPRSLHSLPISLTTSPLQVESGLVYFNFRKAHPRIESVRAHQLRKYDSFTLSPLPHHWDRILVTSFGKRRKTLRSSLKGKASS
jgi:16S rRNA A1518/A1519 N6-dimethyltransferase RsmA/KsgA/DIM1 with predicted DNA glycosylase/AP lyase activity